MILSYKFFDKFFQEPVDCLKHQTQLVFLQTRCFVREYPNFDIFKWLKCQQSKAFVRKWKSRGVSFISPSWICDILLLSRIQAIFLRPYWLTRFSFLKTCTAKLQLTVCENFVVRNFLPRGYLENAEFFFWGIALNLISISTMCIRWVPMLVESMQNQHFLNFD